MPWQVSFALLAAIWGCSFWWIKLGLAYLSPVEVAFTRLLLGATVLLVLCAATGTRLPRRVATWRHLAVVALLLNSVPFTLFAYGETHVTSVLAGIINAMTPLATLGVVLVAFPEEHPTRARLLGLTTGFLGVLVVLGVWQGLNHGEVLGVLACFGAVCCYGVAFPYTRRHLSGVADGPLAKATGQVVAGTLFLVPVLVVSEMVRQPMHRGPLNVGTIVGMSALGVLGSGLAYVLNFRVVDAAGGSAASAVTYLTPVFAVIVGVSFLGERLNWYEPVGALVVLIGVAFSQGRVRLDWRRARH